MAALADGGEGMEELDISALYYAALEEADGTISLDEEEGDEADYYQQLEDAAGSLKSAKNMAVHSQM
jgi:hypothetical protein